MEVNSRPDVDRHNCVRTMDAARKQEGPRLGARAWSGLKATLPGVSMALRRSLRRLGVAAFSAPPAYYEDLLCTHHDHSFVDNERFAKAYRRAVEANGGRDPEKRWKTHVLLWAAERAAQIPGSFVECGVNTGFMSTALLDYLDWDRLERSIYLVDTFAGPPLSQYSGGERVRGQVALAEKAIAGGAYETDTEAVKRNFSEWKRVYMVRGTVPGVLPGVQAGPVSFLHLDMNSAKPEASALEFFWPSLEPGAFVVCDDYAQSGFIDLKRAIDRTASQLGTSVLALPTGQGLLWKATSGGA